MEQRGWLLPWSDPRSHVIPALRAALEAAEKDALRRGHLCERDYRSAGVEPPAELAQRGDTQPSNP